MCVYLVLGALDAEALAPAQQAGSGYMGPSIAAFIIHVHKHIPGTVFLLWIRNPRMAATSIPATTMNTRANRPPMTPPTMAPVSAVL